MYKLQEATGQAPQCHHCKRRGEECSFQLKNSDEEEASEADNQRYLQDGDDQHDRDNRQQSISSPVSRSQPGPSRVSPTQWPNLDIEQSQLRWHYNTFAANSLALLQEDPRRVKLIWKGEVSLKAEHDPWIDHATMAIAALHICHLEPPNPENYYTAAYKNYRNAVVAFPKAVKDMNPQNSVAILSFSLLILMFQLGISCVPGAGPMSDAFPTVDAYNAISALRGTWSLIDQLGPHLQKSHLSALFTHRKHLRFEVLDESHEKMIEFLTNLNDTVKYGQANTISRSDIDRQTCSQALTVLRFWFSIMAAKLPTTWLLLVWWPAGVSPEFLLLLKNKDPMALIIVCHWCAGMHRIPMKWYLDGWARRMLKAMMDLLGPDWNFALQWPMEEVFQAESRE
ncbi:conserved hypothetical protein [Talaromyces marneffei ATCC 18224]|uniref:Zn(2)-C6 fungal-type domain-containing protein n=1 Tax=Talaromyces marneffei (strain ATCC 18224 / CBS 334.59 / QM 7333) TaxID=441960 RepID=B6QSE5_TALMQ|nr:conserved hypothetical protein [Talaromyces marneffei ATCC 18224]